MRFKVNPKLTEKGKNQMKFIDSLKVLFTQMAIGNQKFVDPTDVLNNMTDSNGKSIKQFD